jgi:hypothetical protein
MMGLPGDLDLYGLSCRFSDQVRADVGIFPGRAEPADSGRGLVSFPFKNCKQQLALLNLALLPPIVADAPMPPNNLGWDG